MIAVTTRSRLRGLRFFPAMALATVRVRRQLARTPGAVRWASLVASPTEFWTITVWRSHHELQEFMRSDAHGEIMWSFSRWTRAFWLARWRPTAAEWGSWDGLALAAAEPPAGAPPDSAPAFLRASMDGAGRLTLAASPLVRRSRANLAGLGGIVLRLPL